MAPNRRHCRSRIATPGPYNAGSVEKFSLCMHQLFKQTVSYARRREDGLECLWEWQLWLLRNQWQDLRKAQAPAVCKPKLSLDEYVWQILKRVHKMKEIADREKLMLSMLGDFKRLSTNPRSVTFRPKFKAKGKAKAKAKGSG